MGPRTSTSPTASDGTVESSFSDTASSGGFVGTAPIAVDIGTAPSKEGGVLESGRSSHDAGMAVPSAAASGEW